MPEDRQTPDLCTIRIVHTEKHFGLGLTPDGSRVFIPDRVMQKVRPRVGETRMAHLCVNTRKAEGAPFFTGWLALDCAAEDLPADFETDEGRVYFYLEPKNGEYAWSDKPPRLGDTALVFRFERIIAPSIS